MQQTLFPSWRSFVPISSNKTQPPPNLASIIITSSSIIKSTIPLKPSIRITLFHPPTTLPLLQRRSRIRLVLILAHIIFGRLLNRLEVFLWQSADCINRSCLELLPNDCGVDGAEVGAAKSTCLEYFEWSIIWFEIGMIRSDKMMGICFCFCSSSHHWSSVVSNPKFLIFVDIWRVRNELLSRER